jgi:hypothetical protein
VHNEIGTADLSAIERHDDRSQLSMEGSEPRIGGFFGWCTLEGAAEETA